MKCNYETIESHPGACDGGYQCTKTAVTTCDHCHQDFCPLHLRVCEDCSAVLCFATMESRCYSGHECKKAPEGDKTLVERVLELA